MENVRAPLALLFCELIVASVLWFLWLWPLARAARALEQYLRGGPRGTTSALVLAVGVGGVLRLSAAPTLLYALPEAAAHLDRAFEPWGAHMHWHVHAGAGGYVLHALANSLLGRSLGVVVGLNALCGTLAIPVVYLTSRAVLRDYVHARAAAMIAAWGVALYVPAIRVDASEQFAAVSTLTCYLACAWAALAAATPTRNHLLLFACATATALQTRAETQIIVAGACVWLAVGLFQKRARRADIVLAAVVLVVLVAPRVAVTVVAVAQVWGELPFDMRALVDVFFSWRHVFLSPRFTAPHYPVLAVVGLMVLAKIRPKAALFVVLVLGLFQVIVFNEWILDANDALRFQATSWPIWIMTAGVGAAWLLSLVAKRWAVGVVTGGLAASGVAWLWLRGDMVWSPQALDRELAWFESVLGAVPRGCELLLQHTGGERTDGYYGPRFAPDWITGPSGREIGEFPRDLGADADRSRCRYVYLGLDCYRYYIDDDMAPSAIMDYYHRSTRQPLFTLVDQFLAARDAAPPPGMRPECRAVQEAFELEPVATTHLAPGRRHSRIWAPHDGVDVGIFAIRPR